MGGKEVEESEEVTNLGQTASMDNRQNKEITRRIRQGRKNFWALNFCTKKQNANKHQNKRTIESCTLPSLTYGAQTWALTNV